MITVLLIGVILALLIAVLFKDKKNRIPNFPPGPPKLPIWGSYWYVLKENFKYPHVAFKKLQEKYKTDILGIYMGDQPVVTCSNYDLVKELLTREEFLDRPDNVIIRNRGQGKLIGVFFLLGNQWKDQRWFSLRNLRDFGFGRRDFNMEETVASETRYIIDLLTSKPKKEDADICQQQGVVRVPQLFYGPALNCIFHSLSASHVADYKKLRDVGWATERFIRSIDSTGNSICITPWLKHIAPEYFGWTQSIRDNTVLLEFAKEIVAEHVQTYNKEHIRDFIDVYLNEMEYLEKNKLDKASFSREQLEFVIADYLFPVPLDMGLTISIFLAYMINKPDVQAKVHEEIDRVVGKARLPTLDDRKDLPYTEAALRETIRIDPIVPLGIPRACSKDTTFGGYFIPKGTWMLPNTWAMHNDPKLWGDPENFRPERFFGDDGMLAVQKDFTFGFGAGKRLCAGETFARNTMFLFIAGIMQNFTVELPGKQRHVDLKNIYNGLNSSVEDYYVKFTPRI